MVDREFENRTSLITDPPEGKIPPLTAEAEARIEAARNYRRDHPADGPEDRTRQVRCITYGIPRVGGLGAGYNSYYQIFQTGHHVVIEQELTHTTRIIPLDGRPHISDDIRQWHGDSRGRWDGDTLVVETRHFSPQSNFRGARERLLLAERFTRVGVDEMHYEFTVSDSTTWEEPWTALVPWRRTTDPMFEGMPVTRATLAWKASSRALGRRK